MAIRCKNTECENTFLNSDRFTSGYCEDCNDAINEEKESEDNDN